MSFEPPPDPRAVRRARVSRWLSLALGLVLVGLLGYFAFVGYTGSGELVDEVARSPDCRTPAAFGWAYEAVNYDIAGDAAIVAQPDPEHCTVRPPAAGEAVVTDDGIRIAGWYIPAAASIGPAGPTVLLVHGWGRNKSEMLAWAAVVHDNYNVLAFDLRNHGQSSGDQTTQGALEQLDVKAMLDWLAAIKAPKQVAILGLSLGGAAAVNEAVDDDRVGALMLASTHATLANAAQARLDKAGYPLSVGGAWAILLGGLIRTGEDMSAADPVQAIARLDGRPVLILAGGKDDSIGPNDPNELLDAARAAGVAAHLDTCVPAGREELLDACPSEAPGWVLGFLSRALAAPST